MRRPIMIWPSSDDTNPRAVVVREELQRARRQKVVRRRRRVANIVLVFSFTFLTLYTIATLWLFREMGNEPVTTTTCVFGTFGGNMLFMLVKRICDKKYGSQKDKETEKEEETKG